MKVYDYIVVCKRQNYKLIDGISQLMLLLSMLSFASSVRVPIKSTESIVTFCMIAGITGWLIYCYFVQKKGGVPFFRIGLLMAAVGWGSTTGLAMAVSCLFPGRRTGKTGKIPDGDRFRR
jgi:hypothetical protein